VSFFALYSSKNTINLLWPVGIDISDLDALLCELIFVVIIVICDSVVDRYSLFCRKETLACCF